MANTKIINVLRDDRLEDIMQIFRSTSAEEVIFVLPKRSKAFSNEDTYAVISGEAGEMGKSVLILSENPDVKELATKYSLGLLTSEDDSDDDEEEEERIVDDREEEEDHSFTSSTPIKSEEDREEDEDNVKDLDDKETESAELESAIEEKLFTEEPEEPASSGYQNSADVILAAAKVQKSMNDVVAPDKESSVSVKINKKSEPSTRVGIRTEVEKKYTLSERDTMNEIQSVWQARQPSASRPLKSSKKSTLAPRSLSLRPLLSSYKNSFYALTVIVVLAFAGVLYVSMGKADIFIKPRPSSVDLSIKVSASDKFLEVDQHLKRIPGQLFMINKKVEETFPATGEKDVVQKARGKVTIYNNYGTTPQTLIATTRLESEKGLIFRTLKTVTVPGTTVKNGEISPGKIEVEVIADKAGSDYNISGGKFNLPAFREKGDNDRYQKFYGMSDSAMKGGIIGKAKVVTEKDYTDAKTKVTERILKEAEDDLKSQASGLKILTMPKADLKEINSTAQIDEAIDSFTVSGSADIGTVAFKDSDLFDVIAGYIRSNNDIMVLQEKLNLKFDNIKFDQEAKVLEFAVGVSGTVYDNINEDKIVSDLIGKGEDEIKNYVKGIEQIHSARVVLSPFWVRKVPSDRTKIKVQIEYN